MLFVNYIRQKKYIWSFSILNRWSFLLMGTGLISKPLDYGPCLLKALKYWEIVTLQPTRHQRHIKDKSYFILLRQL